MRSTTKIGIGLISAGVLLFAGWALYLATRSYAPVKMSIPMSVGHVRTSEFSANIEAPYEISIEVEKKTPFDTLNCLLGMAQLGAENSCAGTPPVLNATWILSADGRIVQRGSSADDNGGAWANDTISREIGRFDAKRGQKYQLDVDILTDGTKLASGNPRLTVEVISDFVEGTMFTTALIIEPAAGVLLLVGAVLLAISFFRARRRRKTEPSPVVK